MSQRRVPVARSAELFAPVGRGIELCYQTFGDPDDPPLLLVMGLSGPMTWWHAELCDLLARQRFHVIRYDNRDTGRSTHLPDRVGRGTLVRAFLGRGGPPPYTLAEMARDAVGLLDHLGLDRAHVAGVSMGGMIAQTLAIEHPDRLGSLTSISSTTGKRTVGWQHPKLLLPMLADRTADRDAYVASSARMWELLESPGFPGSPEETRARAEETWDRGYDPAGALRQMIAIVTQPDRGPRLRSLRLPTLVVHGLDDPMVHPSGGRATAAAVPNAELLMVPGMGHDLPHALFGDLAAAIRRTADRAG